jgi:hypothetical protein
VLVWNGDAVGWLIHSVPKWPPSTFPSSLAHIAPGECIYGQSFVWLTLPRDRLDDIKTQLVLMQASVYHATPEPWRDMPRHATQMTINTITLSLSPGGGLLHMAKHAKWNRDLFEDAIVPVSGPCLTETWSRPGQPATAHVGRITRVCWDNDAVAYNSCDDHSKWAVSLDSPWTYIGDINAMASQFHRGGGGALIRDPALWAAMRSLVADYTPLE